MTAPLRAGIAGVGYLGRLHARVLTEIPGIQVAGFFDPDDAAAATVMETLHLHRFESLEALASSCDCVVVATPTSDHHRVAALLMEHGCDVMIEKPITSTAAQARQLIELAARLGRIIQVGHVERYNPAIAAVAPLLRQVRYIEAERLGVFVGRSLDIDVMLDLMIHDLNLVLSLLRQRVVEIRAVGVPVLTGKVDITNVRLELENGAIANLTASRVSQDRVRKIRFFSSNSYISVDTKEQEAKGYTLAGGALQPLDLQVEKREPLRVELEAFVQCVRSREAPLVTAADGLEAVELALRVADEVQRSLERFR